MPKRILFVAMQDSPHAAKWVNLITDRGWDLHLFPVDHVPFTPLFENITIHRPWRVAKPVYSVRALLKRSVKSYVGEGRSVNPAHGVRSEYAVPVILNYSIDKLLTTKFNVNLGESGVVGPYIYGPKRLASLIKTLKPDLVHSMEFQHCGYRVLEAKKYLSEEFPPWLATNWGSDIYYYRRIPGHREQISRLLRNVDFYSCECQRDVRLAESLGLKGRVMPVLPNTGGFDIEFVDSERSKVPTSKRKLIAIKGYQHFAGRALTALDAIEKCVDILGGYSIALYSAMSEEVKNRVAELREDKRLDIYVMGYTDHTTMLEMFGRARIYIGISISDAISTSLLEAMALGAFPIQTDTSCCDEWVIDGKTGLSVPVDDVDKIVAAIRKALADDEMVDDASRLNWETVKARLDRRVLKKKVDSFYDEIFDAVAK